MEGLGQLLLRTLTDVALVESGSRWLLSLLDDMHRGVRASVRDALLRIRCAEKDQHPLVPCHAYAIFMPVFSLAHAAREAADAHSSANTTPLRLWLNELAISLQIRLADAGPALLYRQRADLILLLAHLIHFSSAHATREAFVQLCINLWSCEDDVVSAAAIDTIEFLGSGNFAEVLTLLHTDGKLVQLINAQLQAHGSESARARLMALLAWARRAR